MDEIVLPLEIWSMIFSYLDFKTLQKTATLVSKTWFNMIRDDSILSGKLALNSIEDLEEEDVNGMLSHWKSLKILKLNLKRDFKEFIDEQVYPSGDFKTSLLMKINSSLCPLLKKVSVPIPANGVEQCIVSFLKVNPTKGNAGSI